MIMKKLLGGLAIASLLAMGVGVGVAMNADIPVETKAESAVSKTVYINYSNVTAWSEKSSGFRIYAYGNGSDKTAAWPGDVIDNSKIDVSKHLVEVTIPSGSHHFNFNDGEGHGTGDLTAGFSKGATYTLNDDYSGSWGSSETGWFIVGTTDNWGWDSEAADQGATGSGFVAKWDNYSLIEDEEFKLNYRNNAVMQSEANDWKGWDNRTGTAHDGYVGYGTSGNYRAHFTGTYNIVLTNEYQITVTPTDETVVAKFVADCLHTQAEEDYKSYGEGDRAASCSNKYNAAKDRYDALTSSQLTILERDYLAEYNAYQAWKASATGAGAAVSNTISKSNDSFNLIIIAGAAGAAVAAAGLLFFAKRKRAK